MADRVKVRDLSDEEGQRLQQIVRRGGGSTVRYRRALIVLASAGGNSVPVIARLVLADEDRVREVIHKSNELGMASLDPRWAGGRPRRINTDEEAFIIATAQADPQLAGQPFTRWSLRELAGYLRDNTKRIVTIGRERLRRILVRHGASLQKTKTWKESTDPDRAVKLARIAEVNLSAHNGQTIRRWRPAATSSCVTRQRMRRGPTRSKRTSGQ